MMRRNNRMNSEKEHLIKMGVLFSREEVAAKVRELVAGMDYEEMPDMLRAWAVLELTNEKKDVKGPCPTCEGCGQIANDDSQTPWSAWLDLPLKSSAAVLMGLVRPLPCPTCSVEE
jgi:hypothetical protein